MSWLFTGFEPFQGERINPSQIVAQSLSRKIPAECAILPVAYEASFARLKPLLDSGKYQGLIGLGQAGGRSQIGLERVALNYEDAESPDNDKVIRIETKIEAEGPHAIMNALPLREIVRRLREKVGPVEISSSAGTFVCNSLYYKVFRWMQANPDKLKWQIFVHLPYLPEQVMGKPDSTPFLSQSVMEQAVLELFKDLQSQS